MVDVDRLKEALSRTGLAEFMLTEEALPVHVQTVRDAARLVVAGQPLWRCVPHEAHSFSPSGCWVSAMGDTPCSMVEGVWVPTGTTNPVLTKTDLVVPTGKDET